MHMVETKELTPTYLRPCDIVKVYSIGRTTVWRIMNEMKKIPKYRKSILNYSPVLTMVNRHDFQEFLEMRSGRYLRD